MYNPNKCSTFATPEPPSLSVKLKSGVVLFLLSMSIIFNKNFTRPEDTVTLLESRGLTINNPLQVVHYIRSIGYYRLSAYMFPFLLQPKETHHFKQGCEFQDALNLYRFDKKLRLFLFNEIEKVEIALRSTMANLVAEDTGNIFWMTDESMFANREKFKRTMELVDKEMKSSKEEFILHFKKKYSNPYPPVWMLVEILPIGVITRIYENLADNTLRKKVAAHFGLPVPVFSSWITIVTLMRNSCCHHARVWNKENAICPMIPRKLRGNWIVSKVSPKRIYFDICIIKWFIDIVSPNNDMKTHLQNLLAKFPMVDIYAMGFSGVDWVNEPLWKEN